MRKYWIFATLIALIVISIISMYYIYMIFMNSSNNKIDLDEMARVTVENGVNTFAPTITTSTSQEKVSPNATLVIKKHYSKCGHTTKEYAEIPEEFVNMDEEEIKKEFHDWELKGFSPDEIVILKEVSGICDEHFILRQKDGFIAVYTEKDSGKEELKQTTDISVSYLTEQDRKNLESGIVAIGKEELNSALEDFE